jgi:hypothetical protein
LIFGRRDVIDIGRWWRCLGFPTWDDPASEPNAFMTTNGRAPEL